MTGADVALGVVALLGWLVAWSRGRIIERDRIRFDGISLLCRRLEVEIVSPKPLRPPEEIVRRIRAWSESGLDDGPPPKEKDPTP